MDPVTIREHLRREPFVPLRVYLDDGTCYDVRQPSHAIVSRISLVFAVDHGANGIAKRLADCHPSRVTRIEPLGNR